MLLFSPNWLFLYPGLVLMFIGFLLGAKLLASPVFIQGVRLSIDTLIYSVTMIEVRLSSSALCFIVESLCSARGLPFHRPPKRSFF